MNVADRGSFTARLEMDLLKIKTRPGSNNLYLRGTVKGRFIYESTGTSNRKIAEEIRAKREHELLQEAVLGRAATLTFLEAAVRYMEQDGERRFVMPLIDYFGNDKLMKDITQIDLDRAAEAICRTSKRQTINRQVYTPFIAIWNQSGLENRKWLRPRRRKGTLNRPEPSRSGTQPVTYEEAFRFVSQMTSATGLVMTALFYTGMRPIEIFNLQAHEVFPDKQWIVVSGSKTGEKRGVPMHDFLVPVFRKLKERGGTIFRTHKGIAYKARENAGGQMKSAINGARARSGIATISPYTARHTVSTQLVINGVHAHTKDQILGHAVTDMSRHYTNVPQQQLIEAINTLPVPAAWKELYWIKDPLAKMKFFASYRHSRTTPRYKRFEE